MSGKTVLRYVLLDPTGNITALVTEPAPVERQPELAAALMAAEPTAEQVGFLSPGAGGADVALRMAGGEFCGNAAMCAAALRCAETRSGGGTVRVRVSGMSDLLDVALRPQPDGSWRCDERFPRSPEVTETALPLPGGGEQPALLVRFETISHLILPADFDRALAERVAPVWCERLGAEALGLMLLDAPAGRMTPLVYVPGAGTLFWERSCASGTAAAGAALAYWEGAPVALDLAQPGGTLGVFARPVGEIVLRGAVKVLKVGELQGK